MLSVLLVGGRSGEMFEGFDALLLARIQFAVTVAFHFIFPAFTIGLASCLAVLEGLWLWTGRVVYLRGTGLRRQRDLAGVGRRPFGRIPACLFNHIAWPMA